jgi:hypothetical protein
LDDVLAQKRPSAWFYALRSLVELVMIVPFWTFVWAWIEILILGWVWI